MLLKLLVATQALLHLALNMVGALNRNGKATKSFDRQHSCSPVVSYYMHGMHRDARDGGDTDMKTLHSVLPAQQGAHTTFIWAAAFMLATTASSTRSLCTPAAIREQ